MTINAYKAIQEMERVMKILDIVIIFKIGYFIMHLQKTHAPFFQKLRIII